MMGSIFAGTDESLEKNLKLMENFIKNIEAWDQWRLCRRDQQIDIFKKTLKINRNLFPKELKEGVEIQGKGFKNNISITRWIEIIYGLYWSKKFKRFNKKQNL